MNLNMNHQLSDDWGWFIDVENNNYCENILFQSCKHIFKKNNLKFNKLPIIHEDDEYEYYQQNYKNPEEKYDISTNNGVKNLNIPKNLNENINVDNNIVNIGSTTLITAILTYVIFILL